MAAEPAPRRHDLVWLAPGWEGALAAPLGGDALEAARAWFAAGRPAVASRRSSASPDDVALGIALPPGRAVRRLALLVHPDAVARVSPPLALAAVLAGAPVSWRAALAALEQDARAAGLSLRVYGSLAWQHLSGAPYLTPASDVDVLVEPGDAEALRRALRLLLARGADREPRLDGEVVLPGGRGIAWRELARDPERVLVKSAAGVALQRTRDALGSLAEGLA